MKEAVISVDKLYSIARYESDFGEYYDGPGLLYEDGELFFEGEIEFTLSDLRTALVNIKKKRPFIGDLDELWLTPIIDNNIAFGLDTALGLDDSSELFDEIRQSDYSATDIPMGIAIEDYQVFSHIWQELNSFIDYDDGSVIDDTILDEFIEYIDVYMNNQGKRLSEREFSVIDKRNFIGSFDRYRIAEDSEESLALCRKFTDELCMSKYIPALELKAYSCYGGDRLYKCDWNTSRDYLELLAEVSNAPQYYNSLGYIAYYGRCSKNVPDYAEAFRCFSVAAACGQYEAMYKLGDMYFNGYGCRKNLPAASHLYCLVYEDTLKRFCLGEDTKFADAALRMGKLFSAEDNLIEAHILYLQADYAIKRRLLFDNCFGDSRVQMSIRDALKSSIEQIEDEYPGFFRSRFTSPIPVCAECFIEDRRRAKLTFRHLKNGNIKMTFTTTHGFGDEPGWCPVITIPQINYCECTDKFSITATDVMAFRSTSDTVYYNYYDVDIEKARANFYLNDECVAWISCTEYQIQNPTNTRKRAIID